MVGQSLGNHRFASPSAAGEMTEFVERLCALGEKISGSREERDACDYIVAKLKAYGISHQVCEYDSYISYPTETSLEVLGAEQTSIEAVGVAFSGDSGERGVEGKLVYLADGKQRRYEDLDVRGKIVLVDRLPDYSGCDTAWRAGAAGMLCMSSGHQRHKMTISPIWGSPSSPDEISLMPRIAVGSISQHDGESLKERMTERDVHVRLIARVWEGWRKVCFPVAEIAGREPEFVLLGAHYCTWFEGSTDNVTAGALMLELARQIAARPDRPRYGIRLAWWSGHTHGRYAGSAWYADEYWQDLHDHGIAYFNIDGVGSRGAKYQLARNQMAELSGALEDVLKRWADPVPPEEAAANRALLKRVEKYIDVTRPHRASDQSFWGSGLSSLQVGTILPKAHPDRHPSLIGSGASWWWHSAQETVDKFDVEVLLEDLEVHGKMLDSLIEADLLPFDMGAPAKDFADALKEYIEAAPNAGLEVLLPLVEALASSAARFRTALRQARAPAETAAANRLMIQVLHEINPVLYLACCPFTQDRAVRSRLLPGLAQALELGHLDPGSDAAKLLRAGLKRQINRTAHSLHRAKAMLDTAATDLGRGPAAQARLISNEP